MLIDFIDRIKEFCYRELGWEDRCICGGKIKTHSWYWGNDNLSYVVYCEKCNHLIEIMNKYPDKINLIGKTEMDKDLLIGNLRENGVKIFDLDEEERRKNNEKQT